VSGIFPPSLAQLALGLARTALVPTAILAAGFAGGVAWEHRGPVQPFPLNLAGDSLKAQRDTARADVAFWTGRAIYWRGFYLDWKGAAERCAAARDQDAGRAVAAVETGSAERARAAGQSFNSGYAAGRVAGVLEGRKTCGAAHAPTAADPADPLGDLVDGRLFDDGAGRRGGVGDWNAGAYRPGGEVPADRGGRQPR
jgi:hypothetical protein